MVNALAVRPIRPIRLGARDVMGSALEAVTVDVDDVSAHPRIVAQCPPRQGMVALAHPKEAAKRHDVVGHLTVSLIQHHVVNRPELLSLHVVDVGPGHLASGDQVTGFVGGSTNPPPVSDEEVRTITQQMEEGAIRPKPRVLFSVGENVKVVDGPFADFNGVVEEVKPDKGKLRVLISIFGRATPVELEFVQVERN